MRLLFTSLIFAVLLSLSLPLFLGTSLLDFFPFPITQKLGTLINPGVTHSPELVSADILRNLINSVRVDNQKHPLNLGEKTCLMAKNALNNQELEPNVISKTCPECQSVQIARFSQPLDPNWFTDQIQTNASISAYFLSSDFSHMCVATDSSEVAIALVSVKPLEPTVSVSKTLSFTEDQLWQALMTYRHSQGRSDLQKDENLCIYARKRVQDHLDLLAKKLDPKDYPVADKYPLDAHQGFKADGDSGILFDIAQKSQVAENLAYWPNAQDPIHVIEWGWDTSTEGHREAQLSNDWNSACLSGKNGFYVAIFGK